MQDFTISSTGFVNYFPSTERTERAVKAAYEKFGDNIVIIDGDDDWNASKIFRPVSLCNEWKILILDYFHSGISGISKSGVIISKYDFEKFIKKFNEKKYRYLSLFPHKSFGKENIKIYNNEKKGWEIFFEMDFNYGIKKALVKIINFKRLKKDKVLYSL